MKELVLRIFRVPPRPEPPPGAPGSMRIFQAGRPFFKYQIILWLEAQIGGLVGLLFGLTIIRNIPPDTGVHTIVYWIEILAWIGYVLNIPFTLYLVRLDYEMRWYMVTDRSLRIREGILRIKEKTMTFANIQNLGVKQGPLQRFLGIQDLEVRTAGGGGSQSSQAKEGGESMHIAKFRGVDNAEEIRLLIREGMRRHRDTGLGDPDERKPVRPQSPETAVAAARSVLDEVRALRQTLG